MANHWYAFYPGDYGRDTAHLSLVEDGAYRRLLDHYYSTGRPIPTHIEQVFRICRAFAQTEQEATRSILEQFFVQESDGWHNHRVDREIAKSREITEMRRQAGKESARKRNAAEPTHEPTCVGQVLPQPQPQPQTTEKSKACAVAPVDWIPADSWAGFLEMRKKMRRPPTDRAVALIVKRLERLRDDGHDPGAVLDQSTRNNWQDVFPLKGTSGHGNGNGNTAERRQAGNLSAGQEAVEIRRRMAS